MGSDPVMVNAPLRRMEWWDRVGLSRRQVKLRKPGTTNAYSFDLKRGHCSAPELRGYSLHASERERLSKEAEERPKSKRQRLADEITEAALSPDFYAGWLRAPQVTLVDRSDGSDLRADVVLYEPRRHPLIDPKQEREGRFLIVEIKSCAADYRADGKWWRSLGCAHGVAFAAPPGVISLAELDQVSARVGLYEWTGLDLQCVRAPVFRDSLPLEVVIEIQRGLLLAATRHA